MNKYALFAGNDYYAKGGVNDFVALGASVEELQGQFPILIEPLRLEGEHWAHIVLCETMQVVSEFRTRPVGDGKWRVPTGDKDNAILQH